MDRRRFALGLLVFVLCYAEAPQNVSVRGRLKAGPKPVLEMAEGRLVALEGDPETMAVLADKRLDGADLEAKGRYLRPEAFAVDPFHTRALYVYKDGKRRLITYWCNICSIRTYTPGLCMCCQRETELDLREPDKP